MGKKEKHILSLLLKFSRWVPLVASQLSAASPVPGSRSVQSEEKAESRLEGNTNMKGQPLEHC